MSCRETEVGVGGLTVPPRSAGQAHAWSLRGRLSGVQEETSSQPIFSIPVPRPAEGTPIPNTHPSHTKTSLAQAGRRGCAHSRQLGPVHTRGSEARPRPRPPWDTRCPQPSPLSARAGTQMHRCDRRGLGQNAPQDPSGLGHSLIKPGQPWEPALELSQDAGNVRTFLGRQAWAPSAAHILQAPGAPTLAAGTDEAGVGRAPAPPRQYSQELLSPPPALEVLEARVSPGFQWVQRHRPGLSPPETPGVGGKIVHFQVHEYNFPLRSPSLQIPQQLPGPWAARATQTSPGFLSAPPFRGFQAQAFLLLLLSCSPG